MLLLQIMTLWPLAVVAVLVMMLVVVARVLKVVESQGLNIADNVCEIERSVGLNSANAGKNSPSLLSIVCAGRQRTDESVGGRLLYRCVQSCIDSDGEGLRDPMWGRRDMTLIVWGW